MPSSEKFIEGMKRFNVYFEWISLIMRGIFAKVT